MDLRGHSQEKLSGREDLLQKAIAARSLTAGLAIEFLDINVAVAPDNQSAVATLTGKGRVAGESDFFVQELKFTLKRVEGEWLIYRVETVKTLSWSQVGNPPAV